MKSGSSNFKKERVPNGMLFVYDPLSEDVLIPEFAAEKIVRASDTAISITVVHCDDGATEFQLLSLCSLNQDLKDIVYRGTISTTSGRIVVSSSEIDEYMSLNCKKGECKVAITARCDPKFPSEALCISIYVEQ